MKTRIFAGLAALAGLLFAGDVARACFIHLPLPVQVWADHIEVEINDQVCVKKYDCKFLNPNPQAVVGGTCYMEVEPGAQVDNMSLTVDGKEMHGELLGKEQANKVFTEILQKGGSPALLEFFGNQLIRTQVPQIAPNGTVTVKLQYTTILKADAGVVRMQFLNTNPKALIQPLNKASVRIAITSKTAVKNVYSPTHPIKIVESDKADVVVEWAQDNYLPKTPFVFYYTLSEDPVGASLLGYREPGEKRGYFMLMLSPSIGATTSDTRLAVASKDVVFCADTSSSMIANGQIEQMKEALKHCVGALRDGDRYNIVTFSTEARAMSRDGLVTADEETRRRGIAYVESLKARGGTAVEDAVTLALEQLPKGDGRMKMLFFLTDGQPTIGEADPEKLLKLASKRNEAEARIFVFGIGPEVNTRFLDALALENRGESDYIAAQEKIEAKIAPYFDKVGSPMLTDVKVRIEGVETSDIHPRRNADLFKGGQIILFGRYEGSGDAQVHVTGLVNGQEVGYTYAVSFPKGATKNDFVPRLWAGRKVNFLLSELRRHGENKEVIEEVVELAKRFGIVTPYTAYLVTSDQIVPTPGGPRPVPAARLLKSALEADKAPAPASEPEAQRAQFNRAKELADGRGAAGGRDDYSDEKAREAGRKTALEVMRAIGARTFYKAGDAWYESGFDPEKHKQVKSIRIGSDEYFKFFNENEAAAKYLALGKVTFQFDGTWVRAE
jgi:Ca-activated chloride channel family protein